MKAVYVYSVAFAKQTHKKRIIYEDGFCTLSIDLEDPSQTTVVVQDENWRVLKKDTGRKLFCQWKDIKPGDSTDLGGLTIEIGERHSNSAKDGLDKTAQDESPAKLLSVSHVQNPRPAISLGKRPGQFQVPTLKLMKTHHKQVQSHLSKTNTLMQAKNTLSSEEFQAKSCAGKRALCSDDDDEDDNFAQLSLKENMCTINGTSRTVTANKHHFLEENQSKPLQVNQINKSQMTKKTSTIIARKPLSKKALITKRCVSSNDSDCSENSESEEEQFTSAQKVQSYKKFCPDKQPSHDNKGITILPPNQIRYDTSLIQKLRPHQKVAVEFLCRCLTGNGKYEGYGAILADEMGLGKTLTAISVTFSIFQSCQDTKKAIVVCPASLVKNWLNEIKRWKGFSGKPLAVDCVGSKAAEKIDTFRICSPDLYKVLILSYEIYRNNADQVNSTKQLGMLIADEGHRLKSADSQIMAALSRCPAMRRLVLTGTPIQNDLEEFFAMVNFVNPALFKEIGEFRRTYANPINLANDKNATIQQKNEGQEQVKKLNTLSCKFVLRRTQDSILKTVLPPKTELVVFCRPCKPQIDTYKSLLQSAELIENEGNDFSAVLPLICKLRKVCAHPALVDSSEDDFPVNNALMRGSTTSLKLDIDPSASGKMQVLFLLLEEIYSKTCDRVVVVSNFTSTLDLLEKVASDKKWSSVRLDGSTNSKGRQDIVDRFNGARGGDHIFLFLLSSKAGGVGLNIIGANRLVLFDPDWNPSVDEQAMARVWRDGQNKAVYIYRLLTTGTIEEKIYQRQMSKLELLDVLAQGSSGVGRSAGKFSWDELREIFILDTATNSDTYENVYEGKHTGQSALQIPKDAFICEIADKFPDRVTYIHDKKQESIALKSCAALNAENETEQFQENSFKNEDFQL